MGRKVKKVNKIEWQKENALLLYSFAFLEQGLMIGLDVKRAVDIKMDSSYGLITMEVITLYKNMRRVALTFANQKVREFLINRIEKYEKYIPEQGVENVYPLYVGLLAYHFWLDVKSNRFNFGFNKNKIENIINEIRKEFEITPQTIKAVYETISYLYPEKIGLLKFRELSNKLLCADVLKKNNLQLEFEELEY